MRNLLIIALMLAWAGKINAQGSLTPPSRIGVSPMNAGHIFVLRYQGARFGAIGQEQTPRGPGAKYREATLTLVIEEELKGSLRQHRGIPFQLVVHDIPSMGHRTNLWGNRTDWKTGERLLAICDASSDDAALLLVDAHCEDFVANDGAIEDARLIADLEKAKASLPSVLQVARAQRSVRGELFAYYVGARLGIGPMTDEALLAVIENVAARETPARARDAYEVIVSTVLSRTYSSRPSVHTVWIRTLFRLYVAPPASLTASMRDNLARPFLWSAIGLGQPVPRCTADNIFQAAPAERSAAITAIQNHGEARWKKPMLDWLLATQAAKRP